MEDVKRAINSKHSLMMEDHACLSIAKLIRFLEKEVNVSNAQLSLFYRQTDSSVSDQHVALGQLFNLMVNAMSAKIMNMLIYRKIFAS